MRYSSLRVLSSTGSRGARIRLHCQHPKRGPHFAMKLLWPRLSQSPDCMPIPPKTHLFIPSCKVGPKVRSGSAELIPKHLSARVLRRCGRGSAGARIPQGRLRQSASSGRGAWWCRPICRPGRLQCASEHNFAAYRLDFVFDPVRQSRHLANNLPRHADGDNGGIDCPSMFQRGERGPNSCIWLHVVMPMFPQPHCVRCVQSVPEPPHHISSNRQRS